MLILGKRDLGKKAETYRREGFVPGIVYGPGFEPISVSGRLKEIEELVKKHRGGLFDFQIDGEKLSGILQAVDLHPLTAKPLHFDIYLPSLDKPLIATIPLDFVGIEEPERLGLLLNKTLEELEVECLPKFLPDKLTVDVSNLRQAHQSLYVKDLRLPVEIKVLISPETPVATVLPASELIKAETAVSSEETETIKGETQT